MFKRFLIAPDVCGTVKKSVNKVVDFDCPQLYLPQPARLEWNIGILCSSLAALPSGPLFMDHSDLAPLGKSSESYGKSSIHSQSTRIIS